MDTQEKSWHSGLLVLISNAWKTHSDAKNLSAVEIPSNPEEILKIT